MKRFKWPLLFVCLGIVLAFPLFSMTYYTMVRTSTPEFCASCHEIRPAYEDWLTSPHVINARGFVADCMDCHLPAPHDTYNFFFAKTIHGIKDIFVHFVGDGYDRDEMRVLARQSIKNDQCMKCHRNLLNMPYKRGALLAHKTVLYPLPGMEKKCTDCHQFVGHRGTRLYEY